MSIVECMAAAAAALALLALVGGPAMASAGELVSTAPAAAVDGDLMIVKDRVLGLLRSGSAGTGEGRHRQKAMERLSADAAEIISAGPQTLKIEDANADDSGQRIVHYLRQTRRLATAWASQGCRQHGDAAVLKRVLDELDVALQHFNPRTPRPGNWHTWLIVIPEILGETGLLVEDELPPPLRERLEEALAFQLKEMLLNGANAAWEARNHSYLALLQRDEARLSRAAARILESVRYSSDGGVREDYGYLFHGHIPYAGSYGSGFAETVSQFMYLFDGTRWSAAAAKRELMANLLLEHFRWFVTSGTWDMHVTGRSHASPRGAGGALRSMLLMSQVTSSRQAELRGAATALLSEGMAPSDDVAALADGLSGVAPLQARGFRYWYTCDLGVYRAKDWQVSLRQYSRRVQDYECLTKAGAQGWTLAYGFTHISKRQAADARPKHPWPAEFWDWQRLSGTTNRYGAHPPNNVTSIHETGDSLNFGRSEFSGGAGLDEGGVAGFILLPTHGEFEARKSVTFFKNGYVALGSGIRSTAPAGGKLPPVETTVLQWTTAENDAALLTSTGEKVALSDKPAVLAGVSWCFLDGIGIVFYEPTDVYVRRRGPVTTLWLDHGANPVDARYGYAVLPQCTVEALATFAAGPKVHPVRCDRQAHVVVDEAASATAAVFFESGEAADIKVDRPAIVYLRSARAGHGASVAVQNPLHSRATLKVTLPVGAELPMNSGDTEVTVMPDDGRSPLTLSVETLLGRIYRAGFGAAAWQVDPVRRENLEDYYAFRVTAESDPRETIVTVRGSERLLEPDRFELLLEGFKGHRIRHFGENDIIDRPAPGVIRYRWIRQVAAEQPADTEDRTTQAEGDFRLLLRTDHADATGYFTVPRFAADGTASYPADLPADCNKPPRPPVDVSPATK